MPSDFAAARLNMVESQVRTADVTNPQLVDAIRHVDREAFCPADKMSLAYADTEIPYDSGRYLMRPRDVAKLLMAVNARPGERALAIAAPYAAAVLEHMGLSVTRFDDEDLTSPISGRYDVVVSEGAVDKAPQSWLDTLEQGGRLCVVERRGPVGKTRLYIYGESGIGSREVFDSAAPMLPQFQPKPSFAF